MKLFDVVGEWTVEGMLIAVLKKDEPLNSAQMRTYFEGVKRGTARYTELAKPQPHDRFVILKPTGVMVVVPMTPSVLADSQ